MKNFLLLLILITALNQVTAQQPAHVVKHLKITILSTMLAQTGVGEWGFSALVEADSIRILFDAGGRERTVLDNSKELNIDLSSVPILILSHGHDDHTTGWIPLRNAMGTVDQNALAVTHVAPGFFDTRISANGKQFGDRHKDSLLYIQTGGKIIEHTNFEEIFPGIYLTGPVPRKYPEKNYPAGIKRKDASGDFVEDNVPEDIAGALKTICNTCVEKYI